MIRPLTVLAALALGTLITLDTTAKEKGGKESSRKSGKASGSGGASKRSAGGPQEGQDAPDFTLKDFNGKDVTLSSFEGKQQVFLIFGSYT